MNLLKTGNLYWSGLNWVHKTKTKKNVEDQSLSVYCDTTILPLKHPVTGLHQWDIKEHYTGFRFQYCMNNCENNLYFVRIL